MDETDNGTVRDLMREKMSDELYQASLPLVDFLYKYYHPHARIIITQTEVEVVEGDMVRVFDLRD